MCYGPFEWRGLCIINNSQQTPMSCAPWWFPYPCPISFVSWYGPMIFWHFGFCLIFYILSKHYIGSQSWLKIFFFLEKVITWKSYVVSYLLQWSNLTTTVTGFIMANKPIFQQPERQKRRRQQKTEANSVCCWTIQLKFDFGHKK